MRGSIECLGRFCGRYCFAGFQTANVHVRRVKQGPARIRLQAYLGRRNFQDAVRYTELPPTRFKNFWRE